MDQESPAQESTKEPPTQNVGNESSSNQKCVYIANVPIGTRWQHVKDVFKAIGAVNYVNLSTDSSGQPNGNGVVEYLSEECAAKALASSGVFEICDAFILVAKEPFPEPTLIKEHLEETDQLAKKQRLMDEMPVSKTEKDAYWQLDNPQGYQNNPQGKKKNKKKPQQEQWPPQQDLQPTWHEQLYPEEHIHDNQVDYTGYGYAEKDYKMDYQDSYPTGQNYNNYNNYDANNYDSYGANNYDNYGGNNYNNGGNNYNNGGNNYSNYVPNANISYELNIAKMKESKENEALRRIEQIKREQDELALSKSVPYTSGLPASHFGDTHGLSVPFLESFAINGPINSRVIVANMQPSVTEDMLGEVFSVAGKVEKVQLSKDEAGNCRGYGIIEFSHPVMAVQAISMLHGQEYMEKKMHVRMDRVRRFDTPQMPPLPEGLRGLGKGLGVMGRPLQIPR